MAFKTNSLIAAATAMALGATLMMAPTVRAQEDLIDAKLIPGSFSANIGVVSEYYFRGLSQTDDRPALQGGFDYEVDLDKATGIGAYFGLWGSNVHFNDGDQGATAEIDLYGGFTGKVGDTGIGWDVGFIYYWYPKVRIDPNPRYNFWEAQAALSYDFGFVEATASYNYSPNFFGDSGAAHYPKFQLDVPVGKHLVLSGYVARQYVEKNALFGFRDYTEWNIKAATKIAGFDVFVYYTDTNISNVDAAAAMVVFGVGRSF